MTFSFLQGFKRCLTCLDDGDIVGGNLEDFLCHRLVFGVLGILMFRSLEFWRRFRVRSSRWSWRVLQSSCWDFLAIIATPSVFSSAHNYSSYQIIISSVYYLEYIERLHQSLLIEDSIWYFIYSFL